MVMVMQYVMVIGTKERWGNGNGNVMGQYLK